MPTVKAKTVKATADGRFPIQLRLKTNKHETTTAAETTKPHTHARMYTRASKKVCTVYILCYLYTKCTYIGISVTRVHSDRISSSCFQSILLYQVLYHCTLFNFILSVLVNQSFNINRSLSSFLFKCRCSGPYGILVSFRNIEKHERV